MVNPQRVTVSLITDERQNLSMLYQEYVYPVLLQKDVHLCKNYFVTNKFWMRVPSILATHFFWKSEPFLQR